jgi:DNA-binding CsgD family transcriptional regulator
LTQTTAEIAAFSHGPEVAIPTDMMHLTNSPEPGLIVRFSLERVAALSRAELEVARLASAGLSNEAIARRRGTAERTVANQMACIFVKLRVPTRRALFTIPELRAIAPLPKPPIRWEVLRYRERQVLALAARGMPLKLIAAELGVRATTVSETLRGARSRLGFLSVADLLCAYEANESQTSK